MMAAGNLPTLNFLNQGINGSIPEAITMAVRTTSTKSFIKNKNQNNNIMSNPLKKDSGVILIDNLFSFSIPLETGHGRTHNRKVCFYFNNLRHILFYFIASDRGL